MSDYQIHFKNGSTVECNDYAETKIRSPYDVETRPMSSYDVEQRVRGCIEALGFPPRDVEHARTLEDLSLDSLDRVELVMALEEEFTVDLPDEQIETWGEDVKISEISEFLQKRVGEQ